MILRSTNLGIGSSHVRDSAKLPARCAGAAFGVYPESSNQNNAAIKVPSNIATPLCALSYKLRNTSVPATDIVA
jgi:hypothetical protein